MKASTFWKTVVADKSEIVDFNVRPDLRRRGIGTRLMDEAEALIATRSPIAGIGVGLGLDYGPAQRLYVFAATSLMVERCGTRITRLPMVSP
jgi:ribosomal protein S18 acetylase RimI-like enzyme